MALRRSPKVPKMQVPGHYRRPQVRVPGRMNMPGTGRVGKMLPSFKKFGPPGRRP